METEVITIPESPDIQRPAQEVSLDDIESEDTQNETFDNNQTTTKSNSSRTYKTMIDEKIMQIQSDKEFEKIFIKEHQEDSKIT
jgi:hypothetical protein